MDNYSPPQEWTFSENYHQYNTEYQEQQPMVYPTNTIYSGTTLPETEEMDVNWNEWINEQAMPEEMDFDTSMNKSFDPAAFDISRPALGVDWLIQQLDDSTPGVYEPMLDANGLDEIENILFSSPESFQQTYMSNTTSNPNSPNTTNSSSPSNSQSTPSASSSSNQAQPDDEVYSCDNCPRMFPKRHLLK